MSTALTINRRGTLTLPVRLRQTLGLQAGDQLIAEVVPGGLLLRPAAALPMEMYTTARLAEFDAEEAGLAKEIDRIWPATPR